MGWYVWLNMRLESRGSLHLEMYGGSAGVEMNALVRLVDVAVRSEDMIL
jgi:hypothetical protein